MDIDNFSFIDLEEFDDHKLVTCFYDKSTNLKSYVAIHRGGLINPAFGATRVWPYKSNIEAIKDVLKLSKIMSYKSAMAGLKYGGAKAVIIDPQNSQKHQALLKTYAQKVNYLGGHFITGADVGVSMNDVRLMSRYCKYMVGTKGDPVDYTMIGIYDAILVCIKEIFGKESVKDRSFAIQGLGKTGLGLIKYIYKEAKEIFVTDINNNRINETKKLYPKLKVVNSTEIYKQKIDIFSPCALSRVINEKSIKQFYCKIICGSANSQLDSSEDGEALHKKGILYAPDYVVNAGGLISVVDEYENHDFNKERVVAKVSRIKKTLKQIIDKSKQKRKPISLISDEIAKEISQKFI